MTWLALPWLAAVYVFANVAAVALYNNRARRGDYVGRHRAEGLSTAQTVALLARHRAEEVDDAEPMIVPDFDSDIGNYRHKGGAGRYAHLRTDELDAQAARAVRLRVVAYGEPTDDVWEPELSKVGAR